MTAPQIRCRTSTTRTVAIFVPLHYSGAAFQSHACCSPMFATTKDHSSSRQDAAVHQIGCGSCAWSRHCGIIFPQAVRFAQCVSTSSAPARRHPAMSANIATGPRSNKAFDREAHRASLCVTEDHLLRKQTCSSFARSLLAEAAPALPSAIQIGIFAANTSGPRSIPPGSPSCLCDPAESTCLRKSSFCASSDSA